MTDETPPQNAAASLFMTHKGYPNAVAQSIVAVARTRKHPDRYAWIFTYDLAEGTLELLVAWEESTEDWSVSVLDFRIFE